MKRSGPQENDRRRPVARFTAQTTDGWVHLVGIVPRPALASYSEAFYGDRFAGKGKTK
jgi:hypothetical protein